MSAHSPRRERPTDASHLVGAPPEALGPAGGDGATADGPAAQERPFDPLRLCVYTTVALLAWVFGPWAVAFFAGLGFTGYAKARSRGLTRSDCLLRDTRLVLLYLGLIALAAVVRIGFALTEGTWR